MSETITDLGASEMAEAIRAKHLSPVEVTKAHLERIDKINGDYVAFITVTFGSVMLLALRSPVRAATAVVATAAFVVLIGWAARVALGAHWPSDVVLTSVVCLAWIWAARRVVLPAS